MDYIFFVAVAIAFEKVRHVILPEKYAEFYGPSLDFCLIFGLLLYALRFVIIEQYVPARRSMMSAGNLMWRKLYTWLLINGEYLLFSFLWTTALIFLGMSIILIKRRKELSALLTVLGILNCIISHISALSIMQIDMYASYILAVRTCASIIIIPAGIIFFIEEDLYFFMVVIVMGLISSSTFFVPDLVSEISLVPAT